MFVSAMACLSLCPLQFCNHLEEEERAGCFSYRCLAAVNVLWLFLTVPWVGLLCVIVVFPEHSHVLILVLGIYETRVP